MKFNKIVLTEVFEINKDLGLIVEVVEGKKDNVLTLWLQYKDKSGEWAYKSSKGATGIRIPMTKGLQKYLSDSLTIAFKADSEHVKEDKTIESKIDKMTEEEKEILLKALLEKDTKKESKKTTKKSNKKSTKKDDTLDLTLENIIKKLKK